MKFLQNILRIGGVETFIFFELAILIFFCFIPMKINSAFILDILYFCASDGSFRILKKREPQRYTGSGHVHPKVKPLGLVILFTLGLVIWFVFLRMWPNQEFIREG